MPVFINDHTWKQTESTVYISVPLKAVQTAKVSVICTDEYLKVSFPPFLFEIFFFEPIDEEKSVAKIGGGAAVFTLPKKNKGLWDQLSVNIDKDRKRTIREEAVLKTQKKAAERAEEKLVQDQQEKRQAVERMMKLEEEKQARIQKIKDEERAKATAELEEWREKQTKAAEEQEARRRLEDQTVHQNKEIYHQGKKPNPSRTSGEINREKKPKPPVPPPPRSAGCIKISFSPRVFPTAQRESLMHEEEEWLRKQAEARRVASADLAELMRDLKEEEKNPDWLRDKGDGFFRTGNYQSALNAYDLAIKLNRHIPALFSNRAACHLKLRNLHKALEDSSKALELLTPAVPDNAIARMKAHVRRGTAFCELQLYVEGLQDYQAALKIDPHNQDLQADAQKIRQIVQGTVTSS